MRERGEGGIEREREREREREYEDENTRSWKVTHDEDKKAGRWSSPINYIDEIQIELLKTAGNESVQVLISLCLQGKLYAIYAITIKGYLRGCANQGTIIALVLHDS